MNSAGKQGTEGNSEKSAEEIAEERGLELKKPFSKYTEEQKQFFQDNVFGHSHKEIQEIFIKRFGIYITRSQISAYIKNNHLSTGRTGRFEKGNIPYNKGVHSCPKGCEKGWFKKGQTPPNHREVGEERINVDGYIEIKVAEPNKWRLKHRVVWEKENGPIPEGYIVILKDGNRLNTDVDNLMLAKRSWHARKNQIFPGIGPDLIETAYKYAELKTVIDEKEKDRNGK